MNTRKKALLAVIIGNSIFGFSFLFSKTNLEMTLPSVMFAVGSITYVSYTLIECRGQYQSLIVPAIMSLEFWGCILYLAVISSVVAFMILNYGSSYVSVSEASLFANLTTVISIVAGIVIVHERFTVQQMIGALLIIGSVYAASVNKE